MPAKPPPPSEKSAAQLHALGVKTSMLTGDNPHTASAIAAQVGIPPSVIAAIGGLAHLTTLGFAFLCVAALLLGVAASARSLARRVA